MCYPHSIDEESEAQRACPRSQTPNCLHSMLTLSAFVFATLDFPTTCQEVCRGKQQNQGRRHTCWPLSYRSKSMAPTPCCTGSKPTGERGFLHILSACSRASLGNPVLSERRDLHSDGANSGERACPRLCPWPLSHLPCFLLVLTEAKSTGSEGWLIHTHIPASSLTRL